MSMTSTARQYFARNADSWDAIRSSYFGDEVRQAALQKAYLRPEMTVADIGAGTGYMTAGIAPLVSRVFVIDGSAEMLEIAQKNLSGHGNIEYRQGEAMALPLPDASMEAIFANMYLHHCTDPLGAIREMARALKPGGRLVITDMDRHTHEWMLDEMADVWLGFERGQVREWLEQAGLVNVIVDCSGQSCKSHSEKAAADDPETVVSIFVAVGARRVSGARTAVQERYGGLALSGRSCCAPESNPAEDVLPTSIGNCCSSEPGLISLEAVTVSGDPFTADYRGEDTTGVPQEAAGFSLGCGNPLAMAELKPGETVLDIGSGGGLDAFLAARKVSPSGRVIGVDMTDEMLERARRSAERAGIQNVEFRKGHAESLPVEDGSVDVILSNCVINLTEDKGQVFREAFRALSSGGRLEVSDMVTKGTFPTGLRSAVENWGSCIYGALPEQEYLDLIAQAGFQDVLVRRRSEAASVQDVQLYSAIVSARKP